VLDCFRLVGVRRHTARSAKQRQYSSSTTNRTEESKNQSKGWNVGIAASYGPQRGAAGVTTGGNVGKGKSSGSETSYLTSQVGSEDSQTIIQSGNTTNIIGGQVQGKGV